MIVYRVLAPTTDDADSCKCFFTSRMVLRASPSLNSKIVIATTPTLAFRHSPHDEIECTTVLSVFRLEVLRPVLSVLPVFQFSVQCLCCPVFTLDHNPKSDPGLREAARRVKSADLVGGIMDLSLGDDAAKLWADQGVQSTWAMKV